MLAHEWSAWLEQCRHEREGVYRSDPDEIIANYDREVGHVRDYHGREILELIQNADDAGLDRGPNRVKLVITPEGLCVGNTGAVFTDRGVKSLVVSDNSPKREDRRAFIGNRGLGFRSILNWTECPFVLSGHLRLAFNRAKSINWFERFLDDDRISTRVQRRLDSGHPFPAAILGVPLELPSADEEARRFVEAPAFASTFDVACAMRSVGYDTIIGIPFAAESAFDEVEEQIEELSEEILLFLNNLERVEIGERCWRAVARSEGEVVLQIQDESPRRWSVHRGGGEVPADLLRPDQMQTPDYEVRIAVPQEGEVDGAFFNFLPTEVRFPFGVVAHATVELTNNRQNLADTKANGFIVTQLANSLAKVAEHRAGDGRTWDHLTIVAPTGDLDPLLDHFEFGETLLAALKSRRILPCRDGELRVARNAHRFSDDPNGWLPLRGFGDLVLWTSDETIKRLLSALDVSPLDSAELRLRLNDIAGSLSLEERARLVVGLVERSLIPDPPPPLLATDGGELIDPATTVFLPPQTGQHFDIPTWMQIRFLDPGLTDVLMAEFEVQRSAELRSKLSAYQIRPYSFPSLVSALNAEIHERLVAAQEGEDTIRMEGLTALKRLFEQAGGNEDAPAKPADVTVLVPDRAGTFQPANALYFGAEYEGAGMLSEALYGFAGDEAFVAGPAHFGWDEQTATVEFLSWLGVSSRPRPTQVEVRQYDRGQFFDDLAEQLSYPLDFGDRSVQTRSELQSWVGFEVAGAMSFDRLEDVLMNADPYAVLAWIATEDRAEPLRRDGDRRATLKAKPTWSHQHRRLSRQQVPSYAMWLIESVEWIPVGADSEPSRASPRRCISQPTGAKELQAVFPVPALDPEHPLLQALSIDSRLFRLGLERAGIRPHPTDLSWDECYRILLELPEIDPEGRAAGRMYGMLLEKVGEPPSGVPSYRDFLEKGLLWSRQGDAEAYRARKNVYYLASRLVPQALRAHIAVLPLPASYPGGRADTHLGVQVVRHDNLEVRVEHFVRASQADRFAQEAEELKYFAAAFRFSSNSESRGLPRLAHLEVVLCCAVAGRARIGEVEAQIDLEEDGAFVIEGNRAYILYRSPLPDRAFDVTELAASIAELFALVLEVQEKTTYMLLAKCAPAERVTILGQLIGREVDPVLEDMRDRLPQLHRPPAPQQRRFAPPPGPTRKPEERPLLTEEPRQPIEGEQVELVGPPHQITAVEEAVDGATPSRRIDFRVKATPGSVFRPGTDGFWTVDAEAGEQLAGRFEEAEGRYPLPVGHLQGQHTLHCDLLSFRTAEDRDAFQESLDHGLIERMVEVKSSGSQRGEVTLSGDVVRTAREYGDRFYLYRIFLARGGAYKLVEVRNPMTYDWPTFYRVNPFVESRARHWDLRPAEEP